MNKNLMVPEGANAEPKEILHNIEAGGGTQLYQHHISLDTNNDLYIISTKSSPATSLYDLAGTFVSGYRRLAGDKESLVGIASSTTGLMLTVLTTDMGDITKPILSRVSVPNTFTDTVTPL